MPTKPLNEVSRRSFLKSTASVGGSIAAASVLAVEVSADQPAAEPAKNVAAPSVGYHETPHIREYYEKARF